MRGTAMTDWLDRDGLLELGADEDVADEVLRRFGVRGNDRHLCVPGDQAEDFIGIVERERGRTP
jgi:hypothetical protein